MQDIPKLYTAIAEWLSVMSVLFIFYERAEKTDYRKLAAAVLGSFALLWFIQDKCGEVDGILWLAGMAAAVCVMTAAVMISLGMEACSSLYLTAGAFMKAEFLAALEWQVYVYYFYLLRGEWSSATFGMCFFLIFCVIGYMLFALFERKVIFSGESAAGFAATGRQTAALWAAVILIFACSNMSYAFAGGPFTGSDTMEIFNIRTLFDLVGVVLSESIVLQKVEMDRMREVMEFNALLRSQYAQYRVSQDNIETVNRRYHDLKHQLQALRMETDDEKRLACIDEMEAGIQGYETQNRTGNRVLDTILTGKAQTCQQHDIALTVIADGGLLSGMYVMDICTIFGNALDNAIEYEVQVEDASKRSVHVLVEGRGAFTCIVIENYYEGSGDWSGRLPKTTKKEKSGHGYGLRSIERTAAKYGGHMKVNVRDGMFRVEILLPADLSAGSQDKLR